MKNQRMNKQSKTYVVDGVSIKVYPLNKWWLPQTFTGITLNGKIYLRRWETATERTVRHEHIHTLQQEELGYVIFLIKYVGWWFIRGYMGIPFEREAYNYQGTENYLIERKPFTWKEFRSKI